MITHIILFLIIVINGCYALYLFQDIVKNKIKLETKPGDNPILLAFSSAFIYFLGTFGISDFALSTLLYRKKKWLEDKLIPGTLNTQCTLPVAVMALAYISEVKVNITTLVVCIMAQVLGSYIGPRIVARLSADKIRLFIGAGLIIATAIILLDKLNIMPSGGTATALHGFKLVIAALALFSFGILNNIGIGSFAPTMLTIYALGMSPIVAFPIMMGANTFSLPVGSMQFIKLGLYERKITLIVSIFGILGVLMAVYLVKSLDISLLQWLLVIVLCYTGSTMLYESFKKQEGALVYQEG